MSCPVYGGPLEEYELILPTPPGTNWPPMPVPFVHCLRCSYKRNLNNGEEFGRPSRPLSQPEKKKRQLTGAVVMTVIEVLWLLHLLATARVGTPPENLVLISAGWGIGTLFFWVKALSPD